MSKAKPSKSPSNFPEYVVRREGFNRYFDTPLPASTFHDLVNKGHIVPFKALRGHYLLNDSLRRMGLREVANLPSSDARSGEDLARLAFTLIDPELFPAPAWWVYADTIDSSVMDHVLLITEKHRAAVEAFENPLLKLSYFAGVLDFEEAKKHEIPETTED